MLGRIHEHIDFPSTQLRERIYSGFCARMPVARDALDAIGWMEGQFACGVYAESIGEDIDLTMIEVELKEMYVSSGLVETLANLTGNTHDAETLLTRIRQQIVILFADA